MDARVFVDLIDLQRKFPNVVYKFELPADNCRYRGTGNQSPVVSLKNGSLWPVDDQLIMTVRGQVDVWSCTLRAGKSTIQWKSRKIGFLNIKLPIIHSVVSMCKKKIGSQHFQASLPIQLMKRDNATMALKSTEPEVILEGQNVVVTNANLTIAKTDINRKALNTLDAALNSPKIKAVLQKEFLQSKINIVSTRFRNFGGHALAEINFEAVNAPNTQ